MRNSRCELVSRCHCTNAPPRAGRIVACNPHRYMSKVAPKLLIIVALFCSKGLGTLRLLIPRCAGAQPSVVRS